MCIKIHSLFLESKKWNCGCVLCVSCSVVSNSATLWTVAHQAFLSMEFSGQEYWSGLPFPYPKYLPDPGVEPWSPASQADSLPFELQGSPKNEIYRNQYQYHILFSLPQVLAILMRSCSKTRLLINCYSNCKLE